jgi:hypothetical protein
VIASPTSCTDRSPESLAEHFVVASHNSIELRAPGVPHVQVCGHPNQAIVKERAEKIRAFVAAVIRAERGEWPLD